MFVSPPESAAGISRRDTLWYYALLLGLVGLTLFVLSPNYEENDDLILRWLLRGTMFGVTKADMRPFLPLISHPLVAAYRLAPNVPFYDLLLTALTLTAVGLAFELLRPLLLVGRPRIVAAALVVVFFSVVFAENLLIVNFTRPSILLGTILTLYLVLPARRRPVGVVVVLCGLYFICLGLRHPSAILGMMFGVVSAVALRSERLTTVASLRQTAGHFVGRLWPLALTVILFLGAVRLEPVTPAQKAYAQKNELLGGLKDYYRMFLVPVTPATSPADAATIAALDRWIYGDHERMTPARLATFIRYDWPRFWRESVLEKIDRLLIRNSGKSLGMLLVITLAAALYRPTRAAGWPAFLLTIVLLGLALIITIIFKMPMRVFSPLFGLTILVVLWLLLVRWPGGAGGETEARSATGTRSLLGARIAVAVVFVLVAGLRLHRVVMECRNYGQQHQAASQAAWKVLHDAYPGRTLVCGLSLSVKQLTPMYHERDAVRPLQVLYFVSWSTAMPANDALLYAATGDSVWVRAIDRLAHRSDVVWVFGEKNYTVMKEYLRTNYGYNLQLASSSTDRRVTKELQRLSDGRRSDLMVMSVPGAASPATPAADAAPAPASQP